MQEIRKKLETSILLAAIITGIVFTVCVLIRPKYELRSELILLPKNSQVEIGLIEYYSRNIDEIIHSDNFISAIENSGNGFSFGASSKADDFFQIVPGQKNNVFSLKVKAYSSKEAGMLMENIVQGVKNFLAQNDHNEVIDVRVLKSSEIKQIPSLRNVILVSLATFLLGTAGSFILMSFFFKDFQLSLWRKEEDSSNLIKERIQNQLRRSAFSYQNDYVIEKKVVEVGQKNLSSENISSDKNENKGEGSLADEVEQSEKELKREAKDVSKDLSGEVTDMSKKGAAPENLPIFLPPEEKESKRDSFLDIEALEKEKSAGKQSFEEDRDEPSEDEVKARLNKLLKGDL
ncbi:MAG: hypothetical protein PHQ20_02105 [Candidatus Moranbacteria bacterium]|jgi:hypothetical protein|nr:hypothetical protein [Candidatus Moranbacteria bacterium]